jgi:hypothetical protein
MHRIDGPGATVDKKFTEGDPVGGVPATVVSAAWMNDVQEELISILAAASITPVKGTQDQVLKAIRALSGGVVGSTVNLKMTVATASASATISADEVTVKSGIAGRAWVIGAFSKTINLATTGALGMDVGSAPVNGWLAIYAGLNEATGATTAFAQSIGNAVAPAVYGGGNAPAGVTATALLTVVPTNASSQFKVLSVAGRKIYIQLTAAFSGTSVNANTAITGIVPANAVEISGELILQNTAASAMSLTVASQIATALGQQNSTGLVSAGGSITTNFGGVPVPVAQSIGIIGSSSAGTPTYSVYVSGYSI